MLEAQLEGSGDGVQTVRFEFYNPANPESPLASKDAPLLAPGGSGSGGFTAPTPTAIVTTTIPAGIVASWKMRCIVNGGIDSNGKKSADLVYERVVSVLAANGRRKVVWDEGTTYSDKGWADAQNFDVGVPVELLNPVDAASAAGLTNLPYLDVRHYGAVGNSTGSVNCSSALADVYSAAVAAGGGKIFFPGGPGTLYGIESQWSLPAPNNITLWAPGGARIKPRVAIPLPIAVGNIDTGINLLQGNTLASNAAAGAMSITLASGKGANFAAGDVFVLKSTAVIPEHDVAVVNKVAEFCTVYSVAGDTLNLTRPLRYAYNTADTAEACKITWVENFAIDGLGFDGNSQIDCAIALQLSWCKNARVENVVAKDLQQRLLRLQGCFQARVRKVEQTNGLSHGFLGDSNHFSYMISEGGLNEGLIATELKGDRIRHAYTNGAGWTTNAAVTSSISGIGVPMNFRIGPGVHTNARGAGWDTHECGVDGTFVGLETLGSLGLGFQCRDVRTKLVDCYARDCVGAAIQLGADSQNATLENFRFQNTNLGTDEASSTDWTKVSPIQDNSDKAFLGLPAPNEIDNSSFDLWERGTSFTATGATANRWKLTLGAGAAVTVSRAAHTVGTARGVGRYYLRFNRTTTGSGASTLSQYIDDVRVLAGRRIVVSLEARSDVDPNEIRIWLRQYFGTGGSPSADVDSAISTRVIDVSFGRYNIVIDVPSITGKTIGSNEDSASILIFELPTAAGVCFVDFDAVKLEVGSVPTAFVPTPLALEKERCARWFEKSYADGQNPGSASSGGNVSICASAANSNCYRRTVHMTTRKGRTPTITLYAQGTGTANKVRNVSAGTDIDPSVTLVGNQSFHAGIANSGDVTALHVVQFSWVAAVADFE